MGWIANLLGATPSDQLNGRVKALADALGTTFAREDG
jgi:hypothetical protein